MEDIATGINENRIGSNVGMSMMQLKGRQWQQPFRPVGILQRSLV